MNIQKYNDESFNSGYISIIKNELEELKQLVEIFSNSHYNAAFLEAVSEKDDTGKVVTKYIPNKDAMLSVMITGRMLGFNPIEALGLGKTLDQHAIAKVERGKRLGLSKYQALEQIDIFTSKEGKSMLIVRANIIESVLLANDIDIEVLNNCTPVYQYTNAINHIVYENEDLFENDKLKSNFLIFNEKLHTVDIIKSEVSKGKSFLIKKQIDVLTKVRMTRIKNGRTIVKDYSVTLQDAINWGFMPGVKRDGTIVEKGKEPWPSRYPQMVLKTAIANGGRRIANDLIEGVYSFEELAFDKSATRSEIENEILSGKHEFAVAEDVTKEINNIQ